MMRKAEAKHLLKKYLEGKCTDEEKALVETWYSKFEEDERPVITEQDKELQLKEIRDSLLTHQKPSKIIPLWQIIAATAVIALLATLHFYPYNTEKTTRANGIPAVAKIQPAGNKATLTLPNGKVIVLDDIKSGQVAHTAGFKVTKTKDGQLLYAIDEQAGNKETGLNTIATPRGGQYQVNLPDGSKVWLNALSSLRFAVNFSSFKREVELTGEAYFEIAKKTDKLGKRLPFFVKTSSQTVEVLGTHFNISAYANEQKTKTTLLEGSVKINLPSGTKLLKPGQQAVVQNNHINTEEADIEYVMAWKNGMFIFDDEPIEEIMQKISNWYDVDVIYLDADKKRLFGGSISRYAEISKVLEKLELTNGVHFKIEGRRITVMK